MMTGVATYITSYFSNCPTNLLATYLVYTNKTSVCPLPKYCIISFIPERLFVISESCNSLLDNNDYSHVIRFCVIKNPIEPNQNIIVKSAHEEMKHIFCCDLKGIMVLFIMRLAFALLNKAATDTALLECVACCVCI